MATKYPGTTIETTELVPAASRHLWEGIFATGGITLSQVSVMTGLEPHVIQNWVKRGFVSSPQKRLYSKNQFARIVIINMLRESLQLDRICALLGYLNGRLHDESDDVIGDAELYHLYTDMIAVHGRNMDSKAILEAAEEAAERYAEPVPGAKQRLVKILQVMANAHFAARSRHRAEELLSQLD